MNMNRGKRKMNVDGCSLLLSKTNYLFRKGSLSNDFLNNQL